MYANSEDFQVLAIKMMVSSFVAKWNDRYEITAQMKEGVTAAAAAYLRKIKSPCYIVLFNNILQIPQKGR